MVFSREEAPCLLVGVAEAELAWHRRTSMLPRSRRLRSTAEIQRVLREGHCITTPAVRVCFLQSGAAETRVACVVGKTVHRSAIRRHRYQRWLREVARQFLTDHQDVAYDMVWVARPGMLAVGSFKALSAELVPRLTTLIHH